MTELICIACPKGCRLKVDRELNVSGNACPRGAVYGREEVQNPVRTVTSTVCIKGALHCRCPVKTAAPVPKGLVRPVMQALNRVRLTAPVSVGQVVVRDVCSTGVDIVATCAM